MNTYNSVMDATYEKMKSDSVRSRHTEASKVVILSMHLQIFTENRIGIAS